MKRIELKKLIKEVIESLDDDKFYNQQWGYDEDKYESDTDFLKEKISELFGKENQYSGSADWGGISVWTIAGSKFEGTFIVITDEGDVVLMKRKFDEPNDEYKDTDLMQAGDIDELKKLFNRALKLKK